MTSVHPPSTLESLVHAVAAEAGYEGDLALPSDPLRLRAILRALLIRRPASPLADANAEAQLHKLLVQEAQARDPLSAKAAAAVLGELPASTHVGLWRGDIRRIAGGVIANAANSAMLGCFVPDHRCVDNVIHAAAGPALRLACAQLRQNGDHEPVGTALLTTAGALPADAVAHTVGPQVPRGGKPSAEDARLLAACYTSVLDASLAAGHATVAFPCISTGLFGYPKREAARVAADAVLGWLAANGNGVFVLFVAFSDDDEAALADALGAPASVVATSRAARLQQTIEQSAAALRKADAVIVTGGAGLSASAGVDYTSEEIHARFFPDMAERGYRCMYEYIGGLPDDEQVKWGYLCRQVLEVRFGSKMITHATYDVLRRIVGAKETFCLTSNVDGLLHRNGHFDAERVVERQGTYSLVQCLDGCGGKPWPSLPVLERLHAGIQPDGHTTADLPTCPNCGSSNVFFNVRGGSWFDETPRREAEAAFKAFCDELVDSAKHVVVLEIGCGFNTPTVIRSPNETLTARLGDRGTLIRVSLDHAQVPEGIEGHSISVPYDATTWLEGVDRALVQ